MRARLAGAGTSRKWSGNRTPSSAARRAEREPDGPLGGGVGEPERQLELDRQVEVDVEELGSQLEGLHVAVEVADVEAPQDRPLDLGPALPADLVGIGVLPRVLDACGGTRRRRRAGSAPG